MSCICQNCKKEYMIDLIISDDLWELIKPKSKPVGSGLLCGRCIIDEIEKFNKYGCYFLKKGE